LAVCKGSSRVSGFKNNHVKNKLMCLAKSGIRFDKLDNMVLGTHHARGVYEIIIIICKLDLNNYRALLFFGRMPRRRRSLGVTIAILLLFYYILYNIYVAAESRLALCEKIHYTKMFV